MEEFSVASGISRPTLSRFYNDPQRVRPATRERIERAMNEFGYRPNLLAVNFNRRNPKILGVVVPSLLDPFHAEIVQCIERQAIDAGYWTIIQNSQGDAGREAEAIATLLSLKVGGVIAIPLGNASRAACYRSAAREVPLVFVDARSEADCAYIGTDNAQSMGLMVDYLLRSGSAPAYFDMPEVNRNAVERRGAYVAAMRDRGHEPQVHKVSAKGWDFERIAFEAAGRLFGAGQLPDGTILCANDRIAFGVMAAASQAGIAVGRTSSLRVAGHDDHPLSRYACPSLTTVAQNGEDLASISLRVLLQQVGDQVARSDDHLINARLMMRDSA